MVTTDIFQGNLPNELSRSPCVSCESCHWKKNIKGVSSAYCKVRFDIVYSSSGFDPESETVIKCIDFEMAQFE